MLLAFPQQLWQLFLTLWPNRAPPHPESRNRFKRMTPDFLDIHNICLISQVCSNLLVGAVLPCSHRHRQELKERDWLCGIEIDPSKDPVTWEKASLSGVVYEIFMKKLLNKSMSHAVKCLSGKQKIYVRIPNSEVTKTHPVWVLYPIYGKRATLLWSYLKWLWGIPLYQKYKRGGWVCWFLVTNLLMHRNLRCMCSNQGTCLRQRNNFKYTLLYGM